MQPSKKRKTQKLEILLDNGVPVFFVRFPLFAEKVK